MAARSGADEEGEEDLGVPLCEAAGPDAGAGAPKTKKKKKKKKKQIAAAAPALTAGAAGGEGMHRFFATPVILVTTRPIAERL